MKPRGRRSFAGAIREAGGVMVTEVRHVASKLTMNTILFIAYVPTPLRPAVGPDRIQRQPVGAGVKFEAEIISLLRS